MFGRVKKGLSSLLAIVLVLGAVFMSAPPRAYAIPTPPPPPPPFSGTGAGVAEDPFLIETPEQLDEIRNHMGSHFKLMKNIDLTDYLSSEGAGYNEGKGWIPIEGTDIFSSNFSGTFDGNGHTISGLMIDDSGLQCAGLFSHISTTAEIRNVGLVDVDILSAEVGFGGGTGGLAGVSEGVISNSYVQGTVTSESGYLGGLVGFNKGTIENSFSAGSVSGTSEVGGLAGTIGAPGVIRKSFSMASVTGQTSVGGLVGYNLLNGIEDSYAVGTVNGSGETGGLVGKNGFNASSPGNITNSYAAGAVIGSPAGGLVGANYGGAITNSYYDEETTGQVDPGKGINKFTADMKNASTYTTSPSNWDFISTWKIDPAHNGGYPYLQPFEAQVTYDGNGNNAGTVPNDSNIHFPGEMVSAYANNYGLEKTGYSFDGWNTNKDGSGTSYIEGISFTIWADTTLYAHWTPNSYNVIYDGNGHTDGTVPDSVTRVYNTDVNVSGNTGNLVIEGYKFAGWNTAQDGSGTSYAAEDTFPMGASDITLYAQWLSSNALLGGLSVSEGTLDFNQAQNSYSVDVENAVESIDLAITLGDLSQSISVTGAVYQTVTGSVYHYEATNLVVGANPIQIQVSAQDGTQNNYSLTIQRLSNNADLSGLSLSNGELSPTFSSSTDEYIASVPNNVSSLTVTASVYDSNATMTVNGTAVDSGTASGEITLNVGSNSIPIVVTAQDGTTKTYSITVTRAAAPSSDGSSGGGGGGGAPTPSEPTEPTDSNNTDQTVTINGETQQAIATITTSEQEGQTVLTTTVDTAKLVEQLEQAGNKPVVAIPVTASADKVTAVLTGDAVKAMENKNAILEVQTPNGSYKLPASEIFIDQLTNQLGAGTDLGNITLHVVIAKSENAKVGLLADAAGKGKFTVVVPPVDFTVTAEFDNKMVQVTKFNSFVEREIPLPEGVDASQVTTAVVLNEDGTTRAVPTKIVTRDGVTYVVIKSLTNSTYSVVWNPVEFKDVEQHWSRDAVNDMGSRMIISGVGNDMFNPDHDITRAEFAAIIVRGLGLKLDTGASVFSDVKASAWYNSAVNTAYDYQLINGFEDGTFRPNDKITREQAMVIIAKAMEITKLEGLTSEQKAEEILQPFTDAEEVSSWAKDGVADSAQAGIVSGKGNNHLAPKDFITRAEVASIIERLLKKSELI